MNSKYHIALLLIGLSSGILLSGCSSKDNDRNNGSIGIYDLLILRKHT